VVDELGSNGVSFERYDDPALKTDEKDELTRDRPDDRNAR
jgi:hypothetical protein